MALKSKASKKPEKETKTLSIVPTQVDASNLGAVMKEEAGKRKLLTAYIAHHMMPGTDYGTIDINGRKSKPSLFKPGSEKFLSLFRLNATFRKDTETWEMAGSVPGLFCYICELKTAKGVVVGEGRGSANLKEKNNWTVNNAVKIAEKRAQIDAVLRTGALSDFFTQDLEDMKAAGGYDTSEIEDDAPVIVAGADDLDDVPATLPAQRKLLASILDRLGVDFKDFKEAERFVADNTELALVESNFPEIIRALKNHKK